MELIKNALVYGALTIIATAVSVVVVVTIKVTIEELKKHD